ncbi:hypothetical protein [Nonomuraea sp. NPDC050783]|uniref:hypothetical protein n=1 Tax=Nonomuraea sp. NPDC050783 TaxID=3154634 RepID=UPI003467EAFE
MLLAGARPGQVRPGLADVADLLGRGADARAAGRRAALLLFPPAAALGDLGDLPWVPTSTALAQGRCAVLAFAVAAPLTRRRCAALPEPEARPAH